ncbi:hypothetical protein C0989_011690 [Termitomyces sp. Mn162]|nr:hypothetical protein C0989_011690 [Termitomyces sp. Mn162]
MAAEIQQLSDLIASSVSTLLRTCEDNKTPFPDPKQPFTPQSEAFRASQAANDATNLIAASALQLAARVLPPYVSMMSIASGVLRPVPGRLLRILATDHCYKELTPDVFTNTRLSTIMDSGKCVSDILEKPEDKHEGTSGLAAFLELFAGDGAKSSSQLFENMRDPNTARSGEPNHTPFNRAFDVDLSLWLWYETKDQAYRRRRLEVAMCGVAQMQPPDVLDDVLNWKAIPKESIVVDVGGGIGTSSIALSKKNAHLKFVVQDLQTVCAEATTYLSKEYPEISETGRLSFVPHDFFTPQPMANASVFILKQIMHNWSDPYCARILRALRAAAMPTTKLVLADNIVAYACHDPTVQSGLNSGHKEAPAPLLANYGAANGLPYLIDLGMMVWFNSQERTIGQLDTLLRSTGWQLVSAKRHDPRSNFFEPVVAVPIETCV